MLRTEREAKRCWCPQLPDEFPAGSCLASGCMAWRWGKDEHGYPAYQCTKIGEGHFDNAPQGYCGLAGRPEE